MEMRNKAVAARKQVRAARARKDWKQYDTALSAALTVEPHNETWLLERSTVRLRQRRAVDALADAERLLSVNPAHARGHSVAATSLMHQQKYSKAAEKLVKSLAL